MDKMISRECGIAMRLRGSCTCIDGQSIDPSSLEQKALGLCWGHYEGANLRPGDLIRAKKEAQRVEKQEVETDG